MGSLVEPIRGAVVVDFEVDVAGMVVEETGMVVLVEAPCRMGSMLVVELPTPTIAAEEEVVILFIIIIL